MIHRLNIPGQPSDLDTLTLRFASPRTASSFLSWIFSLFEWLSFPLLLLVSHCFPSAVSPPQPPTTETIFVIAQSPGRFFIEPNSRLKRCRKLHGMLGEEDLEQKRIIEFRQRIASTRPSPELLLAQGASAYEATDRLSFEYRFIVKERLATSFNIRRVFRRPRQHCHDPLLAQGLPGQGRDTPMPLEMSGVVIDEDAQVTEVSVSAEEKDGKGDLAMPIASASPEQSNYGITQGETTFGTIQENIEGRFERALVSPTSAEEDSAHTAGKECPPLGYFAPQRPTSYHKTGRSSSQVKAQEGRQLSIVQPVPVAARISKMTPNANHPLPPLPPCPSTMNQSAVPAETEELSPIEAEPSANIENGASTHVTSEPDSGSLNGTWRTPLSPTLSTSTMATTNVGAGPRTTKHQAQDSQSQLQQSQGTSQNSTYPSGDSTDSDSNDDIEPADALWCALENKMDLCVGRISVPKQNEQTLHRLFRSECRSWDWAGHFSRYVELLIRFRDEARDNPRPRVYFSQAYYNDIVGSPSTGLASPFQMLQQYTSELYAEDKTCTGASVRKPRGPASLTNMVKRRLLQFFKDHPDGAPITPAHIKRAWTMLDQLFRIKNMQRNKLIEVQNLARKKERTGLWSVRPANDDGTHLMRSKGLNSPLAEVISIDEKWPEGWEATMTQPERYKIAGDEKRDPMKGLLESLAPSAEEG